LAVNLTIDARKFNSIEAAVRKFRRVITKSGVLDDYLSHEYFISPATKRRQKIRDAKRKRQFKPQT